MHGAVRISAREDGLAGRDLPSLERDHPLYPSLCLADFNVRDVIPMMKARRMDRASQILISCLSTLLTKIEDRREFGLFVGTFSAGSDAVERFLTRYLEQGPLGANPMVFPNTVLNAAAGQAAIFFGLQGPNSTACNNFLAGLSAVQASCHHIATHPGVAILSGGLDVVSEHQLGVWRSHPDYGPEGFLIGEGCALVHLSDAPSQTMIDGFTQQRVAGVPAHALPDRAHMLREIFRSHRARFGVSSRLYLFGSGGADELADYREQLSEFSQETIHFGREIGVSSMQPCYGLVDAYETLSAGQSADVLGLGFGGDVLIARVSHRA